MRTLSNFLLQKRIQCRRPSLPEVLVSVNRTFPHQTETNLKQHNLGQRRQFLADENTSQNKKLDPTLQNEDSACCWKRSVYHIGEQDFLCPGEQTADPDVDVKQTVRRGTSTVSTREDVAFCRSSAHPSQRHISRMYLSVTHTLHTYGGAACTVKHPSNRSIAPPTVEHPVGMTKTPRIWKYAQNVCVA